jgi:hypothetical protein
MALHVTNSDFLFVTGTKRKVHNWTKDENEAIWNHFKEFIQNNETPGQAAVEQVLKLEPLLQQFSWDRIKFKVANEKKKFHKKQMIE